MNSPFSPPSEQEKSEKGAKRKWERTQKKSLLFPWRPRHQLHVQLSIGETNEGFHFDWAASQTSPIKKCFRWRECKSDTVLTHTARDTFREQSFLVTQMSGLKQLACLAVGQELNGPPCSPPLLLLIVWMREQRDFFCPLPFHVTHLFSSAAAFRGVLGVYWCKLTSALGSKSWRRLGENEALWISPQEAR